MRYQRSLAIERRLKAVLSFVQSGRYSTPAIADRLRVSVPTVSRDVTALRERGHNIRAVRQGDTWCFILTSPEKPEPPTRFRRPIRKVVA